MTWKILSTSFLALCLTSATSVAQQAPNAKNIIPPSPSVAPLKRFLDYPVDHSTGLANVTIPLYEIKLKNFSFPLNMSFHASGRRASSDYSALGLGWALNCLGFVSREVRERPDEDYISLETTVNEISSLGAEQAYDALVSADMSVPNGHLPGDAAESGKRDSEHDIYTYSAGGISGKFVFDSNNNPFPLTYSSHKISMSIGSPECVVTDENGNQYIFGGTQDATEYAMPEANQIWKPCSWLLSSIKTPSGESISFKYETRYTDRTDDNIEGSNFDNVIVFGSPEQVFDPCWVREAANYNSNLAGFHIYPTNGYKYKISFLKEIVFDDGTISFTYDTSTLRLISLRVTDNDNHVVQNASFSYVQTPGTTYNIPNNNDHSLSALKFLDSNNQTVENYAFDYYNTPLPYSSYQNSTTDWWGYCTNASQGFMSTTPPVDPINDAVYGQWIVSDRTPSFSIKQSGMLKRIIYPTGGNTEFVYEPNLYRAENGEPKEGPGLRIRQIISDDGTGVNKITKLYNYGRNEDGMGNIPRPPSAADFVSQKDYLIYESLSANGCDPMGSMYRWGTYNLRTYSTIPIPEMREAYSQPVYYQYVTEYTIAQNGDRNGKTEYTYSIPQYKSFVNFFTKQEWTSPKVSSEASYLYRPTENEYKLIQMTLYGYSTSHYSMVPELKLVRTTFLNKDNEQYGRPLERQLALTGAFPFTIMDNPVESAAHLLTSKEHISYDESGIELKTVSNYFYDNQQHVLPTRIVTTSSNGKTLESRASYPPDINTGNYLQMTNRNMINYAVEQTILVGSNVTGSSLTTYKLAGTSYVPDKSYSVETNSPLSSFTRFNGTAKDSHYAETPEMGFDSYDNKGNILQMTSKNGVVTSYFWSYDQTLPVVQAQNISQVELATKVTTAAVNAGLNTTTWISNLQSEKMKWQNFNTLLRSYCGPNVLVTTYTHKPLVGMTSAADSNGNTAYYEYDTSGRLTYIKDNDFNIVKKYEYHYKRQ